MNQDFKIQCIRFRSTLTSNPPLWDKNSKNRLEKKRAVLKQTLICFKAMICKETATIKVSIENLNKVSFLQIIQRELMRIKKMKLNFKLTIVLLTSQAAILIKNNKKEGLLNNSCKEMIQLLIIISTRHTVSFKMTLDVKRTISHFLNKSITEKIGLQRRWRMGDTPLDSQIAYAYHRQTIYKLLSDSH